MTSSAAASAAAGSSGHYLSEADDADNGPTASEPQSMAGSANPRRYSEVLDEFNGLEDVDEMEPNASSEDEDDRSDSDDDSASSSSSHQDNKGNNRQIHGNLRLDVERESHHSQSKTVRKKKNLAGLGTKSSAVGPTGLQQLVDKELLAVLAGASGQFATTHPQFSGLKSTANSCSQTTTTLPAGNAEQIAAAQQLAGQIEGAMGGTSTIQDSLLSMANDYQQQSSNFAAAEARWKIPNNMREVLTANKHIGAPGTLKSTSLVSRMFDASSPGGSASNSQQQEGKTYCHRSVGIQTMPDNEYPSYFYYTSPCFNAHLVEPAYLKCITPEDLHSKIDKTTNYFLLQHGKIQFQNRSTEHIVHDSSPEGTLRLVIRNFSLMSDTVRGPSKIVQNVPWRIMIMPRQHIVQKKGTQKCLGFFLQCCPDAYSDSWSCQAAAELRLISQKPGIQNFSRKTNHMYTAKENDWGYSCFMTWADILDENQGYILNDDVILEVHVKADPAKNILSLTEFRKKINEYIRVAQMQCERGLIDKAIDCNSQAMKFCKDKDQECLRRLQAQNADLVARKLKQSIARIERGGDTPAIEADPAANITALRIAMTGGGNTARNAASNRSKRSKDSKASSDKRRDEQSNDQPDNTDPTNENDSSKTNNATNTSPIVSDKENDNQIDAAELESAGELHSYDCHCNKGITYEQLASIDPNLIKTVNMMDKQELLKCLEEVAASNAFDPNISHQILCKAIKKHLQSTTSSCQTEFPPMSQIMMGANKKDRRTVETNPSLVTDNKEYEEFVRKMCGDDALSLANSNNNATPTANDNLEAAALQQRYANANVGAESKRVLAPVEKKLKLQSAAAAAAQKVTAKQQAAAIQKDLATRRRGRPATPSGTPPAEVQSARAEAFKNGGGQVIRIKKEVDGRFKAFQGVTASNSKAGIRQSRFELIASSTAAGKAKGQARMQFECERRSFEFLDQHGHKMTPDHFNQFFNQVIKALPDSGAFGTYMNENCAGVDPHHHHHNHMRYHRQPFDFDSSNGSPTSCIKSVETDSLKFSAIDEDLRAHGMASFLNVPQPPEGMRGIQRRSRCSTFPPTATSRLQDIRSYNEEYRETMVRVSLHLYEITNRAAQTIHSLMSSFQDNMNDLFQRDNVRQFPSLVNAVVDFCTDYNLEKNLEELHIDNPTGPIQLKPIDHQDSMRLVFEGQGDQVFLRQYEFYFTHLQNALALNHIEIAPLIRKIISYASEQKRKSDELTKEVDLLRNEQKSWTKEKQQIQKLQKSEKSLNQRHEALKQECGQLKNQQKNWQKREGELGDELSKMRQTVESLNAKIQERDVQHARDVQSLHDVKRNHSKELADKQAALQKLKEQLDEKNALAKKLEQQNAQEKRNLQKVAERAKTAEISLMDNRMEQAAKTLERARSDADPLIRQIEERLEAGNLTDEETTALKKDLQSLQKYKEDVQRLVEEARSDGLKHIEQVKEGKQLSQLPRLNFPKPPNMPAMQPIPAIRRPVPPPAPPQTMPQSAPSEIPKVFLSPHGQTQQQMQAAGLPSMSMPPPQHSPATPSAFRPPPQMNNPGAAAAMMNSSQPPPPTFSANQPPPPTPTFIPNGSVHPKMAPYMERPQQQHPNIPIFAPNNPAPPLVPPTTPGPIGSRPMNFHQPNNTLVDQLRTNGLDRVNLNTFVTPVESSTASSGFINTATNRSCTPAELEQIERMRNVRALWEKDSAANLAGSNDLATTPLTQPSVGPSASKFFAPSPSVAASFGADFTKVPNTGTQPGGTINTDTTTTQNTNTWGGNYGSIWSFNS